jgi:hypothetical protein
MAASIRIEIHPLGFTRVFIAQPGEDERSVLLWHLYTALRPQIQELERAAMREGPRIISQEAGDERK